MFKLAIIAALFAAGIQVWSGVTAGTIAIDSVATNLVARHMQLQQF